MAHTCKRNMSTECHLLYSGYSLATTRRRLLDALLAEALAPAEDRELVAELTEE